jgi:hypothetical protein
MLKAHPVMVTLSSALGAFDGGFDCAEMDIIVTVARRAAAKAECTILFMSTLLPLDEAERLF